jgi:hypothetical protein
MKDRALLRSFRARAPPWITGPRLRFGQPRRARGPGGQRRRVRRRHAAGAHSRMRRHDAPYHQLDLAVCNTRAAVGHVRDRVQAEAIVIAVRALPEAVRKPAGQLKAPRTGVRGPRDCLSEARRAAALLEVRRADLPTSVLVGRVGVLTCRSEPRVCAPGPGWSTVARGGPGPAGASSSTDDPYCRAAGLAALAGAGRRHLGASARGSAGYRARRSRPAVLHDTGNERRPRTATGTTRRTSTSRPAARGRDSHSGLDHMAATVCESCVPAPSNRTPSPIGVLRQIGCLGSAPDASVPARTVQVDTPPPAECCSRRFMALWLSM